MPKSISDWIDTSEDWQKEHIRNLQKLVVEVVPDATASLKWGQPCYAKNRLFCYFQKSKSAVTLGFQQGAKMNDPDGLLRGEGKEMRHVKFAPGQKQDKAALTKLINEAIRLD